MDNSTAESQFKELLKALNSINNAKIIFTKPNADTDGRVIINMIDEFVAKFAEKSVSFTSMGQLRYLSAIKFMDAVIGNSSSGLIEVPSFNVPTINIGDRQQGRVKAASVLDCDASVIEIEKSIKIAMSNDFKEKIKLSTNPYGTKNASAEIIRIIKSIRLDGIIKKTFYNI